MSWIESVLGPEIFNSAQGGWGSWDQSSQGVEQGIWRPSQNPTLSNPDIGRVDNRLAWGTAGAPQGGYNSSNAFQPVTLNGEEWLRIGPSTAEDWYNSASKARGRGAFDQSNFSYDPTQGTLVKASYANPLIEDLNAQQTAKNGQGFWNGIGPWALALGAGAAVTSPAWLGAGEAFGGAGASGEALEGGAGAGGLESGTYEFTVDQAMKTPGFFDSLRSAVSKIPGLGQLLTSQSGGNMSDSFLGDLVKSGVLGPIVGSIISGGASSKAADAQIEAGNAANATQLAMFNQNRADLAPWREAGVNALARLQTGLQPGGELYKPFGASDFQADPGYDFRLSEGLKALQRSAAARGGLLSGSMLKGINRYSQDYASNEYSNAYNRYNQNQSNQFNRLASVSGLGQTTAQQVASLGAGTAQGIAANQIGAGNAQASGYVGAANALSGGLSGATNNYMQNQLINRLVPQQQYASGYAPLIQDQVPGQYSLGNPQYG